MLLVHHHAARDIQGLAGEVGGLGGGEEKSEARDVIGHAEAAERRVARPLGDLLVAQLRLAPEVGSINSDLSLYLHRDPRGDWLGLDARARMQDNGTGLVDTTLYDEDGPVGRVLQATLAMPLYAGG